MPPFVDDPDVDPMLLGLLENVLSVLKDAIESVEVPAIDDKTAEEVFRKRTLLLFAKRCYRVTLAGITLIRFGQSTQALKWKRDQHYSWVAFQYYYMNEPESVLFMAAAPIRQRETAKKYMKFDKKAAEDPRRLAVLKNHEETAKMLYKRFPGLLVVKGKSGNSKTPEFMDWSEPSEYDMMKAIVKTWPDELAKIGQTVPETEREQWIEAAARKAHFLHAGFPSFEMHGNPISLIPDLSLDEEQAAELQLKKNDVNGLLYIYLWYPVGIAGKLLELSRARGFKDRFAKIQKATLKFKAVLEPEGTVYL